MATCPSCGFQVPQDQNFCTACGESVKQPGASYAPPPAYSADAYGRPRDEGGYASRNPAYNYTNQADSPASVLGTGGFIVSMIVMCIPLIGFIISIVWACGGTHNLNRRNHARATLILMVIGIVLWIIMYLLVYDWLMYAIYSLL